MIEREMLETGRRFPVSSICHFNFEFVSDFDIRISKF